MLKRRTLISNTPCADVVVHMDGRGAIVYSEFGILDMQRALFVARIVGNRRPVLEDILLDALLLLRADLVALEHCHSPRVSAYGEQEERGRGGKGRTEGELLERTVGRLREQEVDKDDLEQ